ncbi:lysylphosphatidylglycerol synthase domain-containing protein [Crateriforma conspicua]|uniref:lysylphosphatidylglycerol synthase domain-containing protein n=1 Tax=Crateriforma TaxID=2714592 RepID=UPI0018CE8F09|nr:lysylphosphatidylglycerol synthase domain-containing protein [Crateriforma conspicua]
MSSPIDSETRPPKRNFKPLIRWTRRLVFVLVLVGLAAAGRKAVQQWQAEVRSAEIRLSELDRQIQSISVHSGDDATLAALRLQRTRVAKSVPRVSNLRWGYIALGACCYALSLMPPGLLLRRAVLAMGQSCRPGVAVAAQLIGHLGKYVPGKAMVVVLRADVMRRQGVAVVPAGIAVFIETLLMMAVGASLGGLIICFLPAPAWMRWSALAVAAVATLPTVPPILNRVVDRVARSRSACGDNPSNPLNHWDAGLFFAGWGYSLLAWIGIAAAFTFLVVAIPHGPPDSDPAVWMESPQTVDFAGLALASAASISLAMVIGFASLIPGGAGVRELVLTTLLAPLVGPAAALLSAIAARVVFLVVECAMALAAQTWLRFRVDASSTMGPDQTTAPSASTDTA